MSASAENKDFARQFALVVVTPTDRVNDMVARSGPWSLFAAMSESFPNFIKGDTLETREGLHEAEFNKALQAGGFRRERDRRVDAPAKNSDPLGAGTYLFSNCEWKDPTSDRDRHDLMQGFQHLAERFPAASKHCNAKSFLDVVAKFHDGWKPNAGRARKKQKSADSMSVDDDAVSCSSKMSEDMRMGAMSSSDSKPSLKLGTAFGTGATLSIDPNGRGYTSSGSPSDLARHPLNIATLGDMWTFNDGARDLPPSAAGNSRMSGLAADLDIGLGYNSSWTGRGQFEGGAPCGSNDMNALTVSMTSTSNTAAAGMSDDWPHMSLGGCSSLGKRERDTNVILGQMAQLCMRNQHKTPTPSPHMVAGCGGLAQTAGATPRPDVTLGSTDFNTSNLRGLNQQTMQMQRMLPQNQGAGGYGGLQLGHLGGGGGQLGGGGGGSMTSTGSQQMTASGTSTSELLMQNLRQREILTQRLILEQHQGAQGQQQHSLQPLQMNMNVLQVQGALQQSNQAQLAAQQHQHQAPVLTQKPFGSAGTALLLPLGSGVGSAMKGLAGRQMFGVVKPSVPTLSTFNLGGL